MVFWLVVVLNKASWSESSQTRNSLKEKVHFILCVHVCMCDHILHTVYLYWETWLPVHTDMHAHTLTSVWSRQTGLSLLRLVSVSWNLWIGKVFGLQAWKSKWKNPTKLRLHPNQDGREREQPQGKCQAAWARWGHFYPNLTKPDRTRWDRIRGSKISYIIAWVWLGLKHLAEKYY